MNQNNNIVEYWGERIEKIKKQEYNQVEKYAKEIKEQYDLVEKSIRYELFLFYSKYAKENGLSYIETKKLLKEDEMQQWKISLEEYKNLAQKKENKQYLNEMYIRSRINRLESLQAQIQAHVRLLGEKQEEKTAEILKDIFKDTYNRTTYEIDKALGFQVRYDMFDEKEVNNIVNKPWLESNFSDRIWKDKSNLIDELQKTLMQHVVLGKAASQLSDEFAKKFETSFNKAYRLLNTESAYITEQATLESYKNTNVDEYELLAVLDLRTSEICREMDGKRFLTRDARVGVNYPPFHPNCRTTTIPCVLDEFDKDSERVYKDPITGKQKNIKSDMTYNEWLKQMEAEHGTEKIQAEQKKIKNRAADEKQYNEYIEVLGNEKSSMPRNLEKFRDLKYNNREEYEKLKYEVALKKHYDLVIENGELSPLVDFSTYKNIDTQMKNELIGLKTTNGIEVKSYSKHFVDRVCGSVEQRRSGVEISNIKNVITTSKEIRHLAKSDVISGNNIQVSINPETGNLIQTNPRVRRNNDDKNK